MQPESAMIRTVHSQKGRCALPGIIQAAVIRLALTASACSLSFRSLFRHTAIAAVKVGIEVDGKCCRIAG